MSNAARSLVVILVFALPAHAFADEPKKEQQQWVEGFDKVEFHHDVGGGASTRDFRGMSRGYMTAAWWAPGQMKENLVSWKTAAVPDKARTTFAFIGMTSVLPSELTRGPRRS